MLASLATVKAELALATAADDTFLEALIAQASASIERYCGRTFAVAERTQTIRVSRWRERLVLDRTPVQDVASVTLNGVPLDSGAYEVESPSTGFLLRLGAASRSVGWLAGTVVVTYTAGFATTPADVERCCVELCARAYHARGRDPALRSYESPDVESMTFFDPDKVAMRSGLPEDIADRLDAYCAEAVV